VCATAPTSTAATVLQQQELAQIATWGSMSLRPMPVLNVKTQTAPGVPITSAPPAHKDTTHSTGHACLHAETLLLYTKHKNSLR